MCVKDTALKDGCRAQISFSRLCKCGAMMMFLPFTRSITDFQSPYMCNLVICLSLAIFNVVHKAESSALLYVSFPRASLKDILLDSDR